MGIVFTLGKTSLRWLTLSIATCDAIEPFLARRLAELV
jgi:hypothetical protein